MAKEKKEVKDPVFNDDLCKGILIQARNRFTGENGVFIKKAHMTITLSDGDFDYSNEYEIDFEEKKGGAVAMKGADGKPIRR